MSTGFASCFKNCSDISYSFDVHAKLHPDIDSIHIGDTLWIEATSPAIVTDKLSGKDVDYSGAANMGIAIQIASFHGGSTNNTGAFYVLDSFQYVLVNGRLSAQDYNSINYLYDAIDNGYKFKLGVIGERSGVYGLSVSDAVNVYKKNDKCSKATYNMQITNTNQHLYLYQNSRPGYEISSYERTHLYCFKVY